MKKLLVLLTAVAMLFAFSAIVSAAEFSFYGNARLHTFSWENSREVNQKTHFDTVGPNDSNTTENAIAFDESDRDLDMSLGTISRFGTKIAISDQLTANIEFGLKGHGNGSAVYLRHYNGEYDFGGGKILVGQYWHPFAVNVGYSNQVGNDDDGLGNVGGFSAGRRPQVRLSFGNFALHLMKPDAPDASNTGDFAGIGTAYKEETTGVPIAVASETKTYQDIDTSWPHVAAVYNATYENFTFGITGSFQSFEVSDTRDSFKDLSNLPAVPTRVGRSYDVDSHGLKVGIQGNFGLFTLGATYGFGQNLGNMGISAQSSKDITPGATYNSTYDTIADVDTTAYTIVGSFKVNDMVTLEAGYGKVSNDIDYRDQDDEARAYYLQAAIAVADGFVVTPEIGKYDYEEDCSGNDQGDSTYFGAKWQINF